MQLDTRDLSYLLDMREDCRDILDFLSDSDLSQFLADRRMRRAVERSLEIIGEAAKRVSARLMNEHPEIAWRAIIGLRNLLAHEYGEISIERVYGTASKEVSVLLRELERILGENSS